MYRLTYKVMTGLRWENRVEEINTTTEAYRRYDKLIRRDNVCDTVLYQWQGGWVRLLSL
jgi:hypothetical protein